MGAVSAGGKNSEELWQNALAGNGKAALHEFKKKKLFLPVYRAVLDEFSKKDLHLLRQADRTAQLLLAASREAWGKGCVADTTYPPHRIGVVIGSSRGPTTLQDEQVTRDKKRPTSPLYTTQSSMAGLLTTAFSIKGPSFVVASTCTSGATALALGQQLIQSGTVDLVLVGGVDAPLTESILEQYQAAGVLAPFKENQAILRPFDCNRTGTVLGEGAAALILESEKLANRRNAPILGKLKTVALQTDPGRRASLDLEGRALQQVLKTSLEQSSCTLEEISAIHLHGTGTQQNDLIESHVIHTLFGEPMQQPIIWANKSITGHVLGASPLFQLILALKTMEHQWVPKIAHCDHLDRLCRLRISSGEQTELTTAICLNSGFWGNVSSIVISR